MLKLEDKEEVLTWLLTHGGVESEHSRELIYNTLVKDFQEEAIEVVDSLVGTISWLGGDAYEMEATKKSTDAGYDFLEKYCPPVLEVKSVSSKIIHPTWNENSYVLRRKEDKETRRVVYAPNKKIASRLLHAPGKKEVICIQISEQQRQRS